MLSLNQKWPIYTLSTLLSQVSQNGQIPMVCREPPYPFRSLSAAFFAKLCSKEKSLYRTALSLSATDEVWLCLTLFEKRVTNKLKQGSPNIINKTPLQTHQQGLLPKPWSILFFIFKTTLERTLSQNHDKKRIGGGFSNTFRPTIYTLKSSE
jgi:hypothetical protein